MLICLLFFLLFLHKFCNRCKGSTFLWVNKEVYKFIKPGHITDDVNLHLPIFKYSVIQEKILCPVQLLLPTIPDPIKTPARITWRRCLRLCAALHHRTKTWKCPRYRQDARVPSVRPTTLRRLPGGLVGFC